MAGVGDLINDLYTSYAPALAASAATPLNSDEEYMSLTELKFLLMNIHELLDQQLYQSYSRSDAMTVEEKTEKSEKKSSNTVNKNIIDRKNLIERKNDVLKKINELKAFCLARVEATKVDAVKVLPRIIRLCEKYQFNESETDIFHLMVTVQGSVNHHVLNTLLEEDYLKRITGFQRICGMSEVGIEIFCDPDRCHIKEGIVLVEEDNGTHFNLRTPRTVVQLMYGRSVKSDDLLKIAQTAVEDILNNEAVDKKVSKQSSKKRPHNKVVVSDKEVAQVDKMLKSEEGLVSTGPSLVRVNSLQRRRGTIAQRSSSSNSPRASIRERGNFSGLSQGLNALLNNRSLKPGQIEALESLLSGNGGLDDYDEADDDFSNDDEDEYNSPSRQPGSSVDIDAAAMDTDISSAVLLDDDNVKPYPVDNQLEYLEECFQIVQLMVRGNAARMKDDMKKEGTRMNHWDSGGDVKHGRRELQAKLKLHESRVERRVNITRDAGCPLPRLELIAERLGLDSFEKKIVIMLIGKTVSPVVKTLMDTLENTPRYTDDTVTVGQALGILCQDFQMQVANRKYFYRSGRLMTNGIISLNRARWHQGNGDLTDNRITLDRRVLDWAVGLDSEINELVEGSDLYEPKVNLSQVVLPPGYIEMLMNQCLCYDAFKKYRTDTGLDEILTYGNSLVVLLCGKSGTGKTMTVNAIAKELGKKVLLVDFASLSGKRSEGNDMEADLRGLFREAQMSNAVLFFDECEAVFKNRNQGGDRLLNSLLTEIERHEGIVFLATNRPYELDEAMHRRITCVLEYRSPDHLMRRQIWENLLHKGITLAPDVNIASIAAKFELTGGFIKNAVISSVLSAISRDKVTPVVTQADLISGCKLQMRGVLSQRAFEGDKVLPLCSVDDLELSSTLKDAADTILRFEKSRSIIYGSWGTDTLSSAIPSGQDLLRNSQQKACIVTLAGPVGSGKRTFMKALAFDLGRTIKLVHLAELLTENTAETIHSIQLLIQDARLADAIVVIDGFEHIFADGVDGGGATNKLQLILSRLLSVLHAFPGCVVLICHMDAPQNITLQRDFAAQLFCFLRFVTPPHDIRAKLWARLLPPRAPLAKDINFAELGRRFELNAGSIRAAIARASAEAAMRDSKDSVSVSQKDLLLAGELEVAKFRHGNFEVISKLFN